MRLLCFFAASFLQAAPYGELPFSFEQNRGQAPAHVRYFARTGEYGLLVQDNGLDFRFANSGVLMELLGAKPAAVTGLDRQTGVTNYFQGQPSRWLRGVPHFARVRLGGVYPGVDLICYGDKGRVEYDFVVSPGADPARIRFRFGDASVDSSGDLVLTTPDGVIRHRKPVAWQTREGKRIPVAANFRVKHREVSFDLGSYDHRLPLVIDPTVVYSTYVGSQFGWVYGIAVGSNGAAYLCGRFAAIQGLALTGAGFVMKLNPSGNAYEYINVLNTANPKSVAVTSAGAAIVTGNAGSDLPVKNAYQSQLKGESDMFLLKFTPAGTDVEFATYYGGSAADDGLKVKLDATGAIYVLGSTASSDFPQRSAAYSSGGLGLVKFTDTGSNVIFSTPLGLPATRTGTHGALGKLGLGILPTGGVVVSATGNGTLPLLNPILTASSGLYMIRLSTLGVIEQSTWLPMGGGPAAVDSAGNVYVAGPMLLVPGAANNVGVARFAAGTANYEIVLNLGAAAGTNLYDMATDAAGNIYVAAGSTGSLPAVRSLQTSAGLKAYLARITPSGTIQYGTYLGGSGDTEAYALAVDPVGAAYIGGYCNTLDLPLVNPAAQNGRGLTGLDGFVAKIVDTPDTTIVPVSITTNPPGLSLTVDGVATTAPFNAHWITGSVHTFSTSATQGSGNRRYRFQTWSTGSTLNQTIITPQSQITYTAAFATEVRLETDVFPTGSGAVTVAPPSTDGFYAVGTQVSITATPSASFIGYTGALSGLPATQTLTIIAPPNQAAITVLANFSTAASTSGLGFVPVTPCRLLDTRNGQFIAGNTTREIAVTQGTCGIPTTARAYSLNATVVPHRPLSFLTLYPTGQLRLLVSTLNAYQGQIIANAAIVPAGTGGSITAFVTDDTDLVMDINGYFTDVASPEPLSFFPLTPCRVIDTRTDAGGPGGQFGPPSLVGGVPRSFPIQSGNCNVPTAARAYALNVTVVPSRPLDYITVFPTQITVPFVSTQNSPSGYVLANMALVPAGTNGAISLYAPQSTDAVVDITGYFAPASSGSGGLRFFPLTPCRLADTRDAAYAPNGPPILQERETRDYLISGRCGVPNTAQAYSLNATVVPPAYLGFVTLFPGPARPFASTLNAWEGQVAANAALVPARGAGGVVTAYVSNVTHLILDINGYFAPGN
ncbi:MAG: hypothetical protein HY820_01800 [Acidobacteria bacterium]|nr:hypothetical protein [Acidobacteriota bacterium]